MKTLEETWQFSGVHFSTIIYPAGDPESWS